MKKILAMLALVLTVVSMAACKGGTITFEDIEISGYKTEFVVGDKFDKGDLVVTAVFTDDSTKDVTAEAQVNGPAALDKAGAYVVKVVYGDVEKFYQITVNDLPNATYANVNAAVEAGAPKDIIGWIDVPSLDLTTLLIFSIYTSSRLKISIIFFSSLDTLIIPSSRRKRRISPKIRGTAYVEKAVPRSI